MIKKIYRKQSKKFRAEYGSLFKKFVLNELIFFVTYRCNLRCRSCFYIDRMVRASEKLEEELTLDEILRIALSIGPFDNLFISGGEPFLRDDLHEICRIFYLHNNIKNIHLPSNGAFTESITDQTYRLLHKCPGIQLTVSLPLDGLPLTHDNIKGIAGNFNKVIETITTLAELKKRFNNLKIYIVTTVNNLNVHEIVRLADFVKNTLPVDGHGPSPLRGIPYDKTLTAPSNTEWKELATNLIPYHHYWNKKTIKKKIYSSLATKRTRYLYQIYSEVLGGNKLPFKCQAGNIIGVLEPNGEVKLCELTEAIGNVRTYEYDFKSVWLSGIAHNLRKKIKDCSCTNACFLWPSIELSWPAFLKSSFF